jgi:uncharacterized membrane protein (GlpM family)
MARMLITVVIAYLVTHFVYLIANYYPTRELGVFLGSVVELAVWLLVCAVAYSALGKFPGMRSRQA